MNITHFCAGILALTLASTTTLAADRVNSKESLRLCKNAAEEQAPAGATYKFKRKAVTSVDSDRYTHLINFIETKDTDKSAMKLRCETSRSGEILVLNMEPGRWKM